MGRLIQSLKKMFLGIFVRLRRARGKTNEVVGVVSDGVGAKKATPPLLLPPPLPSAPAFPDFEFRPSDEFLAAMGADSVFRVVNPMDLLIHKRNLMVNVLVVEVCRSPGQDDSIRLSNTLWFRFDSDMLEARGMSLCRLFTESMDSGVEGVGFTALDGGVCGWVIDRKRA